MLTEGIRNLEIILSSGSWPIKLSFDLFIPFFWWVFKTRMWFILHRWPDDTHSVTNASKLTVQETHSACQAVQNQCLCNQSTMNPASAFSILLHVWLIHDNGEIHCMYLVCERLSDKWRVVYVWPSCQRCGNELGSSWLKSDFFPPQVASF